MTDQNKHDTGVSGPLNVHSAAVAFEGLLSAEETENSETEEKAPTDSLKEPQQDQGDEQPSDEGNTEPQETEQPGEQEESEPGEEPEETEQPQLITVKIDGKDEQVPLDELTKGYSRTQDYTRKTQALAQERKAFQAERETVQAERQQYATYLTQLKEALESAQPKEPDWDQLRMENPEEFAAKWAEWSQHKQRVDAVEKERLETMQRFTAEQVQRFKERVESERGLLLEKVPAWKDDGVRQKEKAEMMEYAMLNGFTADDVNEIVDHRAIVLLRKAMLFDKAEQARATAKAKIEKVTTVVKPGSNKPKRPMSEATKAQLKLVKTGRVADAAKVFEQLSDL